MRHQIVKGRFRAGDMLPDRTWFMREFAANRLSVQNAFDELVGSGFFEAVRGHGLDTVTNIDDVPVVFAGERGDHATESAAYALKGWATDDIYRHFADLCAKVYPE